MALDWTPQGIIWNPEAQRYTSLAPWSTMKKVDQISIKMYNFIIFVREVVEVLDWRLPGLLGKPGLPHRARRETSLSEHLLVVCRSWASPWPVHTLPRL
jgi:hypothetical protein